MLATFDASQIWTNVKKTHARLRYERKVKLQFNFGSHWRCVFEMQAIEKFSLQVKNQAIVPCWFVFCKFWKFENVQMNYEDMPDREMWIVWAGGKNLSKSKRFMCGEWKWQNHLNNKQFWRDVWCFFFWLNRNYWSV